MFRIDFEKGFRISFWVNVILIIGIVVLSIMLLGKNDKNMDELNYGLSDMKIEEGFIDFYPTRYAYLVTVDNNTDKLTFTNVPMNADAVIEINGNENLEVGYNQVTVVVKSKNSDPVIYYIDVEKIG